MTPRSRQTLLALAAVTSLLLLPLGCSSEASAPPETGFGGSAGSGAGAGHGGSAGAAGSGGGSAGTGGALLIDAGDDGRVDPDAACESIEERGTATPLNLYVMMDRSQSMAEPQADPLWAKAVSGLKTFLQDPLSAGVKVGLKFFPRQADAIPACDLAPYMQPTVPFATLPANTQHLVAALDAEVPGGFSTPTFPALRGAIQRCREIAETAPLETAAVLLITDGAPGGTPASCEVGGVSLDAHATQVIADVASQGKSGTPRVLTFVIGLPGVDEGFARSVAQAGGTEAIIIDALNTEQKFRDALAKVRGAALPCEYELPARVRSGEVEFDRVNVNVQPSRGAGRTLPQSNDCSTKGWHYDDPSRPQRIILCPSACGDLKSDYTASIQILLECPTIIQ